MAFYRTQKPAQVGVNRLALLPFAESDKALLRAAFTQQLSCIEYKTEFKQSTAANDLMAEPARDGTLIGSRERRVFVWWNYLRWRLMAEVEQSRHKIVSIQRCACVLDVARREYQVRSAIVAANEGLTHRVILKYKPRPDEYDEYHADARYALLCAMDKFDAKRGVTFASFACRAIMRVMIDKLRARKVYSQRFVAQDVDMHMASDPDRSEDDEMIVRLREIIGAESAGLTGRESRAVRLLYGVDGGRAVPARTAARAMKISQAELAEAHKAALEKLARSLATAC